MKSAKEVIKNPFNITISGLVTVLTAFMIFFGQSTYADLKEIQKNYVCKEEYNEDQKEVKEGIKDLKKENQRQHEEIQKKLDELNRFLRNYFSEHSG